MKKFFTTCLVALGLSYGANAQVIATFEDGANDILVIADNWYEAAMFIVEPGIGENDAKNSLNSSDKCAKAVNVADADWWGNWIEFEMTTPVTVTEENRYLKFAAYRSIQPKTFMVYINGTEAANEIYDGNLSKDGEWEGVVVDLGAMIMGQEFKTMRIQLSTNWSDPRSGWGVATYMFDNFELSSNIIPPGAVEITDLSDFNINFEDNAAIDKWITSFDVFNENSSYAIVNNPFTNSAVNAGGKVVKFNKSADASWWQGTCMYFTGGLKISDDYQYLHVMLYVPEEALDGREQMSVELCAKDFTGGENTELFTVWDDEVDEWTDRVMRITKITHISELTVRFDIRKDDAGDYISSPANTFYFDEITLNNNDDRRTYIDPDFTGIAANTLSSVAVSGEKGAIRVSSETTSAVKVYNLLGGLVNETIVTGETTLSLATGIYLVETSVDGVSATTKVVVK